MKKILFFLSTILIISLNATAQKSAVFVDNNVAIRGYDVVAYFKDNKPVKGKKELSYNWNNAAWYFSNKENLADFKAAPEKFAPQYGGYCAYGTSEGHKAPTQPDAFSIVNGRLYFNYNKDVQIMWLRDTTKLIEKADKNWQDIKDKE
ncbi:MAG: YHS domain-containing (seleno)protein [Panacibacter sp.]